MRFIPYRAICLAFTGACLATGCAESDGQGAGDSALRVSDGMEVSIEYTLRLEGGKLYDTNVGAEPMTYTHGRNQMVRGLETALEGMTVGESTQVAVPPSEGYGEPNPLHVSEIRKELIPPDARKIGTELQTQPRHGERMMMKVKEVKEDVIVMDLNHPLAGKTLYFDVKILDVKTPAHR